jgi:geranylgeranyl reductase family protein
LRTEAAIIGAGPSGVLAATQISKQGYQTTIVEEHKKIGEPNHCAGLISAKGLERLGIAPSDDFVQNSIYGGRVYSPDGDFLIARDKRIWAYVIDRTSLDQYLADKAKDVGTEFKTNTRVIELLQNEGVFNGIRSNQGIIKSNIIIDGEGASGRLLRKAGLVGLQKGMLTGLNIEINGLSLDPDLVEVWFSERFAKGLFAWVIPINENKARVGLATSNNVAFENLKTFVRDRFNVSKLTGVKGGVVCTGGPINKTVWPGLLVIGDAAGHTKPTTGGGFVIGSLCAKIAGNVVAKALSLEDYSLKTLKLYEIKLKEQFYEEFRTMLALRKFSNRLSDDRINRIFHSINDSRLSSKLIELIEDGDMDMQSKVIRNIIMNPKIIGIIGNIAGKLILSEMLSIFK